MIATVGRPSPPAVICAPSGSAATASVATVPNRRRATRAVASTEVMAILVGRGERAPGGPWPKVRLPGTRCQDDRAAAHVSRVLAGAAGRPQSPKEFQMTPGPPVDQ